MSLESLFEPTRKFRLIKLLSYFSTNMAAQRDLPFVRLVRE